VEPADRAAPIPLVDIHCHVLPGLDDGPRALDDALAMLRFAEADGVTVVVASSHAHRADPASILEGVESVNAAARAQGLTVQVLPGSEIRLESNVSERLEAGELLTINGTRYVLIELSLSGGFPPHLAAAIYELGVAGYAPVLAHAERYPSVQRDPSVLVGLIDAGVVIQINADSILGIRGRAAERTSRELLGSRLAHVVASDAHSMRGRPPGLSAALEVVGQIEGACPPDQFRQIAQALVRGDVVSLPEPRLTPRQRWWSGILPLPRRG
jgi:protein-tyrosine phosphatase